MLIWTISNMFHWVSYILMPMDFENWRHSIFCATYVYARLWCWSVCILWKILKSLLLTTSIKILSCISPLMKMHNSSVVQWQIRGAHLKTRDLTASQRILGGKDQVVSFLVSIRRLFHTSWPHYLRSSKKDNLRIRFEHDICMKTLPLQGSLL